jgi:hypothetical protein
VPTQQGLRRHEHPLPALGWEDPCERCKQRTIGRAKRRPRLLPSQHRQLMPQHEQLDVLGKLAAPVTHEQAQHDRERKIDKGEQHPPMLPEPPQKHLREVKSGF